MLRRILGGIGLGLVGVGTLPTVGYSQSSSPLPPVVLPYRVVLNRYCVTCHNERLKTAGLMLDQMNVDDVSAGAPVWEKVVRKLRTGAMPPAGMVRPDSATYDSFATYLETELDSAKPNLRTPAIHRLNRAEYTNAIRDLLAIQIDGRELLPADNSSEGFDNMANALSASPALLEGYMSAARKISRLAIGDPTVGPVMEEYVLPKSLDQDDRMGEDFPFESRGGIAIRKHFPLAGEYVIRIRLRRNSRNRILGLYEGIGEPHELEVRLDHTRLQLFRIGGERKGKATALKNIVINEEDDTEVEGYDLAADAGLEFRFPAKAGTHLVTVAFLRRTLVPEDVLHPVPLIDRVAISSLFKEGDPAVASVTISGPYAAKAAGQTPSRDRIFVCHPEGREDEERCAKTILATLARRAYRRPVTDGDLQPLLNLYRVGRSAGGFEPGIQAALQGMLVSPEFLIRIERDPENIAPGAAYRISGLDLASRLSFFLWSSVPDDELLDLAERGKLNDSGVLEQQVRRMLGDSRSKALVSNFAGQWLSLRNMRLVTPDPALFPDFDENLREAFEQETTLFVESMLREDHSVLDLLTADYTFVNERLARHYQIPDIHGSHFRRVKVADENRRGLLGQGSILTVTSYATRTSVVLRGKWLLESILGAPPPPPPPNVPSLKDRGEDGKILSVREQTKKHRANPVCASCHMQMDPLGFALENFDAIGRWRTTEGAANALIDSSGELTDGTKFEGPAELRKVLLRRPERFVATVTEKLLTYALGQRVEYYDAPAVRKIVREAAADDYCWSSIILGVVKSTPFQMRRSPEP